MKHTVEGIYNKGKITISENIPFKGKSRVLVVFLEDSTDKADRKEQLLKTFGSWEDDREAESIINDIYSSRVFRKDDILL